MTILESGMNRHYFKVAALITFLIAVLTGTVIFLSRDTSMLPDQIIETEHARVHDVLKGKLFSAEQSLLFQSKDLAENAKLIQELGEVRDKLLVTTPKELKEQSGNKWNTQVFDQLIDWKQKRESAVKQADAAVGNALKADAGSISSQINQINWWKKSPDLVLAFASVPMKDGSTSSILIAYGEQGKEFNAGKRYDETSNILTAVTQTQDTQLGLFKWEDNNKTKIYIASVSPVFKDNTYIGAVVVGMEVSKKIVDAIDKSLPEFVELALVYASPKFGESGNGKPNRIFYTNLQDDVLQILKNEKFNVSSEKDRGTVALAYDQVKAELVYQREDQNNPMAFSRVRWVWDPLMVGEAQSNEELDVFVITNLNRANQSRDKLQGSVIIAAVVLFLLGLILAYIAVSSITKSSRTIRRAIADAINSGDPIDSKAMAMLIGAKSTDLPQYTIHEVTVDGEDSEENWENLMMDFEDAANVQADAATPPEELKKLKDAADAEEARPLYEEYMKKRRENGIDAPMEFDVFLRRLQRNAAKIKETHHCENVTFQVHVTNGNVVLKPKLVK